MIIGSSAATEFAWSSIVGTNFSDFFLLALNQRRNLNEAFWMAQAAVGIGSTAQTAWINDNGILLTRIPDGAETEELLAPHRYLRVPNALRELGVSAPLSGTGEEPKIDPESAIVSVVDGVTHFSVAVTADPDGLGVEGVEAVLYPPSFDPTVSPTNTAEVPSFPTITLTDDDGDGVYEGSVGLTESGAYSVGFYAQGVVPDQAEADGVTLEARPVIETFFSDDIPLSVAYSGSHTAIPIIGLVVLLTSSMLSVVTVYARKS